MSAPRICWLGWMVAYTLMGGISAYAQKSLNPIRDTITNITVEDEITITYDLEVTDPALRYKVAPYYIDQDGNRQPITEYVRGSLGDTISAGYQKQIFWNHLRALPNEMGGMINIEIDLDVSPIPTLSLEQTIYTRGTKKLSLSLGMRQEPYYYILDENWIPYDEGPLESSTTQIRLPASLPLDHSFRIRVDDPRSRTAYTPLFTVKRKIPKAVLYPVIGASAIVAAWIIKKSVEPDPLPPPHDFR
uniref:Uncharacterized protein n=1 Tax=Roseihalotalea indica TaxID=2867963 RepID=A0AA49GMR3_9BACT|nr:hypothetical protein K4G66_22165 [Tunicatimonas sp. TK19036]